MYKLKIPGSPVCAMNKFYNSELKHHQDPVVEFKFVELLTLTCHTDLRSVIVGRLRRPSPKCVAGSLSNQKHKMN